MEDRRPVLYNGITGDDDVIMANTLILMRESEAFCGNQMFIKRTTYYYKDGHKVQEESVLSGAEQSVFFDKYVGFVKPIIRNKKHFNV